MVEEGEGSCGCTAVVLAVLAVLPTLAGEGMGEKLGRRRDHCVSISWVIINLHH